MIIDARNEFCDAVALNTGGAASYAVGSIIDLGATPTLKDIGEGDPKLFLVIIVQTTATSGGAATGQFHLVSDATTTIAVDGSATYHFSTAAFAVATLVAGYRVCAVQVPSGRYERYLGIVQTTAVAAFTAGKIDAFLTDNPGRWTAYPNAVGA
jgi:hypothetical protein